MTDPFDGALCSGKAKEQVPGADPWFPDSTDDYQKNKVFCRGCPATSACLQKALAIGAEHGVWGGTTPTERRALLTIALQDHAA